MPALVAIARKSSMCNRFTERWLDSPSISDLLNLSNNNLRSCRILAMEYSGCGFFILRSGFSLPTAPMFVSNFVVYTITERDKSLCVLEETGQTDFTPQNLQFSIYHPPIRNSLKTFARKVFMRDKNQLFANDVRREVFEYVSLYPCTRLMRIAKSKQWYSQRIIDCLRELKKQKYVKSQRTNKDVLIYYPTDMLKTEDKIREIPVSEIYACLNSAAPRRVGVLAKPDSFLRFMYEHQDENCPSIARKLGMSYGTLRYILEPFVEQKILNKYKPANHTNYSLNLELLLGIVEYQQHRKEIFLNKVGGEVLNPKTKSNFRNVLVDGYELHLCVNPMKEYLEQADLLGKPIQP